MAEQAQPAQSAHSSAPVAPGSTAGERAALDSERWELLGRIDGWLEQPMLVLGFTWLALIVADFIWRLSPTLAAASNVIWALFVLEFVVKLLLAPKRLNYLRTNWLTALSLVVPALRIFRVVSVFRALQLANATRGLQLLRALTALNRGMQALGATMGRRGIGYVLVLTAIVIVAGAAGIYAFDHGPPGSGMDNYGVALWYVVMLLTTIGSDYWPKSAEGRVLTIVLSLYAIAVFGYITASLASFFVDRDAEDEASGVASERSIAALREEVTALRAEIQTLTSQLSPNARVQPSFADSASTTASQDRRAA